MVNKDNSERIERYLREQMTPEENEAFLYDLRNDKNLREEAQMMALLIKDMKEEQAKEDAEIKEKVFATKKKTKNISMVRWTLSIAAIFLLIFGATTLWNKQSKHSDTEILFAQADALFVQYYSYDVTSPRGGDDDAIKQELVELYNKVGSDKDISPVISRLQTIYDNVQSRNEDYQDYGNSSREIAWYLALAYIKDHNLDKAKELLKPLAEEGIAEAIELLNKIQNL